MSDINSNRNNMDTEKHFASTFWYFVSFLVKEIASVHPQSIEHSVSAIAVIDLANELIIRQCLKEAALTELGPSFIQLYEAWQRGETIQEHRLPEDMLILLWTLAEQRSPQADIGISIGCKINENSKGILANWISHCNTLSEAGETFSNNISLLNPSENWAKVQTKDMVKLSFHFTTADYPNIAIDRSMSAMLAWSRELSSQSIEPCKVSLQRPNPLDAEPWTRQFGKNVLFAQTENAIWLVNTDFHQSIQGANTYLKRLLASQAMAMKAQSYETTTHPLSHTINHLLSKNLAKYCHIDEVCNTLHTSRSTLYRKLKAEDKHFTQIVKLARFTRLDKSLAQTIKHAELSDQLGFQDIGSYYRFRKVWERESKH